MSQCHSIRLFWYKLQKCFISFALVGQKSVLYLFLCFFLIQLRLIGELMHKSNTGQKPHLLSPSQKSKLVFEFEEFYPKIPKNSNSINSFFFLPIIESSLCAHCLVRRTCVFQMCFPSLHVLTHAHPQSLPYTMTLYHSFPLRAIVTPFCGIAPFLLVNVHEGCPW